MDGNKTAGHSDVPYPLKAWTGPPAEDLKGREFGTFRVLGVWADHKPDAVRWVVRCQCGAYELRKSKSIKNPANAEIDRCVKCRDTVYLRRHSKWLEDERRKDRTRS